MEKWGHSHFFYFMEDVRAASIRALVEPILSEGGIELVELVCRPHGGVLTVRLLVDKVGGVTVQDCTKMNQRIDRALGAADVIAGGYTLEVSSPGLDRPLRSPRDYERAVGEDVKVLIRSQDGTSREQDGQLLAVQPEAIVLKTTSGNVTIPLHTIHSAKKVIRL